jgi:hypothetical protein
VRANPIDGEHQQRKENPDPKFGDFEDVLKAGGESFKHRR